MSTSEGPVLRPCRGTAEWSALVRVWRSAVEATHDFLAPEDVDFYESRMLGDYLPAVDLTVAEVGGSPAGFSGLAGNSLEMLFVDSRHRGHGVGSALLRRALDDHPDLHLDVNEQNPQAVGFYTRHGFVVVGRSATDADGRPFPILHMGRSTPGPQGPDVDWFWGVIEESSRSRDRLRDILGRLPKAGVHKFQDLFLDFAAELQDEEHRSRLGRDESEDGLEDAAHWVVSQGRARYAAVLAEPSLMPSHVDVGDPANLGGIAYEVYHDRFGEPLDLI